MTGMMGIGAITKKRGGYTNTMIHGFVASFGYLLTLGGLYAIYHNKTIMERPHFTSRHGQIGIAVMLGMIGPLLAGGIFLHPAFGTSRTTIGTVNAKVCHARVWFCVSWICDEFVIRLDSFIHSVCSFCHIQYHLIISYSIIFYHCLSLGIDKTNKVIRRIHKLASRILMAIAWGNSIYGLYGMRKDHPMEVFIYGFPLLILMPMTLI